MEESPLTLQARPEHFEPKVAQLYRQIFENVEDEEKAEGFWTELFLLKPDVSRLTRSLEERSPDFFLHYNHITRELLSRSVTALKFSASPSDEHALETLSVLLKEILSKRYQSPSSDIIEVLAGLDEVDHVFTDLVATLDGTIANGRTLQIREQAVRVVMTITSFGFQTSLLTYVTQRDLFPELMQLIQDDALSQGLLPLVSIGVLANCNKFEIHNPYQSQISALYRTETMEKLCMTNDDITTNWSLGGTLSYVGLGSFTKSKPIITPATEAEVKLLFSEQPSTPAALLLATYEFVHHNKQFCTYLIGGLDDTRKASSSILNFLSFTSYLLQHAYRSVRSALYSHLVLLILRILVEDSAIEKRLFETTGDARLCRQRQPLLPVTKGDRPLTSILLDVAMDCINHNLRTKLDVNIYHSAIGIILRIVSYLSKSRSRLPFHWPELWRSLLAFVRFLTQYASQLKDVQDVDQVVQDLVNLLTICLTQGELFLPDSSALDDLFYKLVESNAALEKLGEAYNLDRSPVATNMATLVSAASHFRDALDQAGGKTKNVRPHDVMKGIKQGYDTLMVEAREGTDHWTQYREPDFKAEIKKITRLVVADAKVLSTSAVAQ